MNGADDFVSIAAVYDTQTADMLFSKGLLGKKCWRADRNEERKPSLCAVFL